MPKHSGPYKSQDPNKSDEVIDAEAALAYAKLLRRERPDDICKELGISRATFYRRIEMLTLRHDRPSRSLMQYMAHEQLTELAKMTHERISGEVSNADYAKLASELRQQELAILKLYEDTASVGDSLADDEEWSEEGLDDAAGY